MIAAKIKYKKPKIQVIFLSWNRAEDLASSASLKLHSDPGQQVQKMALSKLQKPVYHHTAHEQQDLHHHV